MISEMDLIKYAAELEAENFQLRNRLKAAIDALELIQANVLYARQNVKKDYKLEETLAEVTRIGKNNDVKN